MIKYLTLTTEPGAIGGVPVSGKAFGTALNADAIIDMDRQFDYYDGGGLDLACLGLAQCDERGNINVSRFGPKLAGAGGFINISLGARKVVLVGTFTAGGLEVAIEQGRLRIVKGGKAKKFVKRVEQITFCAAQAVQHNKPVLYVTERSVFQIAPQGLALTEVAPGIDVGWDVLAHTDFDPLIADPHEMDPRIFRHGPMGLKDKLLSINLPDQFTYDASRETMFVNFEGVRVRTRRDLDDLWKAADEFMAVGKKISEVVNYDGFEVPEDLVDAYADAVKPILEKYYRNVSRYTTSAFMRMNARRGA